MQALDVYIHIIQGDEMCSLLTTDPCPSMSDKKTTGMDFVVWYLPLAALVLNIVVPCSESPWVLGKIKS